MQDYGGAGVRFRLQGRDDDVGFGAHPETVPAVGAGRAPGSVHAHQRAFADQAVECAHRAQVAAPAPARDQQIEQEYCQDDDPGQPHPEHQAPLQHGDRVHRFPGNGAGDGRNNQRHEHDPDPGRFFHGPAKVQFQAVAQPVGAVRHDVDGTYPGTVHTAADQEINNEDRYGADDCRLPHGVSRSQGLQQDERGRSG